MRSDGWVHCWWQTQLRQCRDLTDQLVDSESNEWDSTLRYRRTKSSATKHSEGAEHNFIGRWLNLVKTAIPMLELLGHLGADGDVA